MKQDIQKASAEKKKVQIELDTKVKKTEIASEMKVIVAEGEANAIVNRNIAEMDSFYFVQLSQAKALGEVKNALNLSDTQFLDYIEAKMLKEVPEENMLIGLDNIEEDDEEN